MVAREFNANGCGKFTFTIISRRKLINSSRVCLRRSGKLVSSSSIFREGVSGRRDIKRTHKEEMGTGTRRSIFVREIHVGWSSASKDFDRSSMRSAAAALLSARFLGARGKAREKIVGRRDRAVREPSGATTVPDGPGTDERAKGQPPPGICPVSGRDELGLDTGYGGLCAPPGFSASTAPETLLEWIHRPTASVDGGPNRCNSVRSVHAENVNETEREREWVREGYAHCARYRRNDLVSARTIIIIIVSCIIKRAKARSVSRDLLCSLKFSNKNCRCV